VRRTRLPLTYDECRARFRRSAVDCGLAHESHPIAARGPEGQELTIELVAIGPRHPRRAAVILSGVHGVEGFAASHAQCDLLERLAGRPLADATGVILVHAVNPWGMAWGRRQNESNVDLNRNWRRTDFEPLPNDAYDELHSLACPDTPEPPAVDDLLQVAGRFVTERGLEWVRNGLTGGQYRHPDGLHYGGAHTEASNRVLEDQVVPRLAGVEHLVVVDLHTGHGPFAALTLLSDASPGTDQDRFFAAHFPGIRVETSTGDPSATTGPKQGQIANGIRDHARAHGANAWSTSVEVGTVPDTEQLVATYLEQWVHRCGDPAHPDHAAIKRRYRSCFTPDDEEWETAALDGFARVLDLAVAAVEHTG
jgi:predicted deacylase